ncbi:MAG: hypothetical protein ACSLEZ_14735 [Thiobacillus sp.]
MRFMVLVFALEITASASALFDWPAIVIALASTALVAGRMLQVAATSRAR